MSITTVRLQPDVEEALLSVVETTQRSKNWLINQAIREFVAREEIKQKHWGETLEAMESVALGHVVDGDKVYAWLQSWGTDKELPPPGVDK